MQEERNNFKAGLFVMVGLVMALAIVVSLSSYDTWFEKVRAVEVRYALSDGLKGLKAGAPVTCGGDPCGRVIGIHEQTGENGLVTAKIVRIQIPARYPIYENARIEQVVPLIGGVTTLNITAFGEPVAGLAHHGESALYEASDPPIAGTIAGSDAVASAARELGIGEAQRRQIQSIIANVERLTGALGTESGSVAEIIQDVRRLSAALAEDVPKITANTTQATEDFKSITQSVRGKMPQWTNEIDVMAASIQKALKTANELVASGRDAIDENRPNVRTAIVEAKEAMTHVRAITAEARASTLKKLHDTLDEASAAVKNIRAATGNLDTFITAETPVLEKTLANLRIVSDQLKLASIEIRRSPWRLMYTPTEKEIETDNLYDAARSFSLAAASLDSTAKSLQAIITKKPDPSAAADPNVKLMLDNLHQTFEKFKHAEDKFWESLGEAK